MDNINPEKQELSENTLSEPPIDTKHFNITKVLLILFVVIIAALVIRTIYYRLGSGRKHSSIVPKEETISLPTATIIRANPAPSSGSFLAVNYTQATHPGPDMWRDYNPSQVRADLDKIRAFGFNGVRVQIPAYRGAFDWPTPTATELAHLEDFYRAAKDKGIKLHLTMFDLFGGKIGYIGQSRTWATAVINALKSVDPTLSDVYVLETHNEMFTGATYNATYSGGFDSGWPAGVAKPTDDWAVELIWVKYMTYTFRSLAPGIPVTTSVPSAQYKALTNPIGPYEGLGYYYHYSHGTDWQPTWYDYHCYGAPNNIYTQLSTALAVVGGNPQMLHIGEFGYNINGTTPTIAQQILAARYEQNTRYYAHQLGLPEPQWWMLYDVTAGGSQFSNGQSDGLLTVSSMDTPAGNMYRIYPPGTVPPLAN